MQLPDSLRQRIDILLDTVSMQDLKSHYQSLSERYRRDKNSASLQLTSAGEALAYVAARLPATFGSAADIYSRLSSLMPDYQPRTMLDLGAGPGTATLAAVYAWDSLSSVTLIEPNIYLNELSGKLLDDTQLSIRRQEQTLQKADFSGQYDLVAASYVLNEIPSLDMAYELQRMWNAAADTLIVIEPGTPLGFEVILKARDILLGLGAHIAAPCPHALACPLALQQRWCHFSVRVARAGAHRLLKDGATLGYEDEKFSYLVVTRKAQRPPQARILGHPHGQKIVELELCGQDGTFSVTKLSKRDLSYKEARKASWGDGFGGGRLSDDGIGSDGGLT